MKEKMVGGKEGAMEMKMDWKEEGGKDGEVEEDREKRKGNKGATDK